MQTGRLAADFSTEPYWLDGLPPFEAPATEVGGRVDVAIIGGGFAGLSAGLTLARAGRAVAILEAGTIGSGAAARSAGSLGHVLKASLADLSARYGRDVALAAYREAHEARDFVERLIRDNQIRCGLRLGARFVAAHSARAFARQREALPSLRETWPGVELLSRAEQRRAIASDAFHGGLWVPDAATLQPALLQRGLARVAVAAGARLHQNARVTALTRRGVGFELAVGSDRIEAGEVVLATNAETHLGPARFRTLARRLIVMPAFCLATEELAPEFVRRVLPIGGPVTDTYKIIHYIAPDDTGRRFIVSARAGRSDGDLRRKAERMFGYFAERCPDLAGVRVSHCWTGRFAVTADWTPHLGIEDGVHYVLGCNGTGIPMATWLGHRVAERLLGLTARTSAFDRPLPSLPFRGAENRVLPLAVRAYALRDRLFR